MRVRPRINSLSLVYKIPQLRSSDLDYKIIGQQIVNTFTIPFSPLPPFPFPFPPEDGPSSSEPSTKTTSSGRNAFQLDLPLALYFVISFNLEKAFVFVPYLRVAASSPFPAETSSKIAANASKKPSLLPATPIIPFSVSSTPSKVLISSFPNIRSTNAVYGNRVALEPIAKVSAGR